jgi:hypothetical protein
MLWPAARQDEWEAVASSSRVRAMRPGRTALFALLLTGCFPASRATLPATNGQGSGGAGGTIAGSGTDAGVGGTGGAGGARGDGGASGGSGAGGALGTGGSGTGGSGAGGSGTGGSGTGGSGTGGSGTGGSGTGGRTGSGGAGGSGGMVGTGGVTGSGGACVSTCATVGATSCSQSSATALETCQASGGCAVLTLSTCSAGLACSHSGPAACFDPSWAAWVMPNGPVDVAAGAPAASADRYTDNLDGTVTDKVTGLMWQKAIGSIGGVTTFTWANALAYCPTLNLGGHTDWRLPSAIELVSIVDYSVGDPGPTINATMFPGTPGRTGPQTVYSFWSSSLLAGSSSSSAWFVDFSVGAVSYGPDMTGVLDVRCVR